MRKKTNILNPTALFLMLNNIHNEDCYLSDFLHTKFSKDALYTLELYNLVFISVTEQRVLLTASGEKVLQALNLKLI